MDLSAIIICGGFATRMGDTCKNTPKSMLQFNGRPYLVYLVSWFIRQNISNIIISTGHLSKKIEDYFQHRFWEKHGVKIVKEDHPLDTGGAMKFASPYLESNYAFTCYGDTTTEVDLSKVHRDHLNSKASITVVLSTNQGVQNQGAILVESNGRVKEFQEKPKENRVNKNLTTSQNNYRASSTGCYIINKKFLQTLPEGKLSFEQEVVPKAVKKRLVYGFNNRNNFFLDWGTPERHQEMLDKSHLIETIFGSPLERN